MDSVNKITNTVAKKMGKSADRLLKHKYLNLLVVLLIALYAGMAAPALPNIVVECVDSTVGKLVFLFLIGFVASRNIQVALMVAVAFVVTLHVANVRTTERFINRRNIELFNSPEEADAPEKLAALGEECVDSEECASGMCEGEKGFEKCVEKITTTDDQFTDYDPASNNFSNFEGFWEGAEGAEEIEGSEILQAGSPVP